MSNYLFIGGMPKSGTTLIYRLLDGHKDLLVLPSETRFFSRMNLWKNIDDPKQVLLNIIGRAWDYKKSLKLPRGTFIKKGENWRPTGFWREIQDSLGDTAYVENLLLEAIKSDKNEKKIFSILVDIYKNNVLQSNDSYTYVVEKTPGNERYLKDILRLFPNFKMLHMIRDPFDVVHSIMTKNIKYKNVSGDYFFYRMIEHVMHWKDSFLSAMAFKKKYPLNYQPVLFDNMINFPEITFKKISSFLDIPFDESMLFPTSLRGQKEWNGHTASDLDICSGKIDKRVIKKNAAESFRKDYLASIGDFVAFEYNLIGWKKYERFIPKNVWNVLFVKYKNEKFKSYIRNRLYFLKYLGKGLSYKKLLGNVLN